MKIKLFISASLFIPTILCSISAQAAVLHFFTNPRVPQTFFHVSLEYQGMMYEADTRKGGHKVLISEYSKTSQIKIYLDDQWVNPEALESQLGLKFDYDFIWGNDETYCSELVGLALGMSPKPMSFAGTHYLDFYPDWIERNDVGISPEQIYEFGILHGQLIQP